MTRISQAYISKFTKLQRCWIAEKDGEIVGSVFVTAKSRTIAKLRFLYVEPAARRLGIGFCLVSECIRFARQAGYKKMVLWTQSELDAARHIYKQADRFNIFEKSNESHRAPKRTQRGLISQYPKRSTSHTQKKQSPG